MQEETKRAIDSEKNLKLLLNVYQNVDKDKREKVNIAYSQQKTKDELLELKKKIASGEVGTESEAKQSLEKIATKMRDLKTAFNEKAKQEEVLLQELESTGSSLDEYEEKNARLTSELKHKEEQMFELMAAKMKAEQARGKLALQGPVHAQEKIKTLDAEVAKKDALVVSLKNGEKHTREAFKASEKRVRETESQLAAVMQEFNQKNAFFGGLQLDLQNQNTQFAKLKLQLVDSVQVSTKLESTVRAKDQQVERIKSDVSRLQSVPSGAGADMYKSTVMLLTKKLNCTICTKRPKNAFINQCMHVFCYDCLIGLIDNRSRKCPKCLLKFGKDDVRKLYMDMDDS